MKYFDKNFSDFFVQLATNNNKEWFHAHKKDYETFVKIPFENFVTQLILEISKHESLGNIQAKQCIGRINRDIRFSKDKSPYNLHLNAFISPYGSKDKSFPGLFLRFAPDMVGIMGGCYRPSKEQTSAIRNHIKNNLSEFEDCYSNNFFYEKYGDIKGETIKRIPVEFKEISKLEKLILNKQWFFVAERTPELVLSENLLPDIMEYYFAAKPLSEFFKKALKTV
ncbi:DUF2461 domain-containing protein [Galbibacter sp. EGI 63066]|uniref:DUF2461 domain-containing protein n=1 Tax=Galbibacter sp. EGI 63066 TaxID=2993559 RepID=UPI0022491BF8|nr:DUF2461 domain-containing protein [Galbibacter sp. EGI 63066]MCX2681321.1 DUF2461 domain-containing protein [Galbibacter sp. EGI 63066]